MIEDDRNQIWAQSRNWWYVKPPKLNSYFITILEIFDTLKPVLLLVWISLINFNNWSDKHHMTKSTSSFNFLLNLLIRVHLFRIPCFCFCFRPPSICNTQTKEYFFTSFFNNEISWCMYQWYKQYLVFHFPYFMLKRNVNEIFCSGLHVHHSFRIIEM